jgi:large subunit ribosomal protein L22
VETKARARFIRISPRKASLVVDMIRGKRVDEALNILSFCPKKGARIVRKLIDSAIANATKEGKIDVDKLYVKKIFVNEGPIIKRFMPRAMGRATPIRKRTAHLTVVLDEK